MTGRIVTPAAFSATVTGLEPGGTCRYNFEADGAALNLQGWARRTKPITDSGESDRDSWHSDHGFRAIRSLVVS